MVDPLGFRPIDRSERLAPAGDAARKGPVERAVVAPEPDTVSSQLRTMTRDAAARPPVDHDRVAKIKAAIERDEFPIVPATVADRLIALKLHWDPNESA